MRAPGSPGLGVGGLRGGFLGGRRGFGEDAPAAAAGSLGLGHGDVGVREQGGQVAVGRAVGDADAGAVGKRLLVAAQDAGGWAGELFRDLGGALAGDARDDDDEFIAAVAADDVVGAYGLAGGLGYG